MSTRLCLCLCLSSRPCLSLSLSLSLSLCLRLRPYPHIYPLDAVVNMSYVCTPTHECTHTHTYTHKSLRPSGSARLRGRGLAADMWPRTRRRRSERKWEVLLHLLGGGYGTQAWRPSCLSTFTMAIGAYIIACQLRRFSKRQRMQRAMRLRLCGMVMACVFSS